LKVALTANALSLGGTEKALETHAVELARLGVDVRVVGVKEGGPRAARLEKAGIEVAVANGRTEVLAGMLAGADLVHAFRAGVGEPIVPAACRAAGIEVLVESNVFGAVDASPDEPFFACHLLPSKFCALRYRERTGLTAEELHRRHRVSYWPVDIAGLRELAVDPAQAKAELGLDPARPLVCRIGRDNDRKWRNLLVDMVPSLFELAPEAQVALVGATPAKLRRLERAGSLEAVRLFLPTSDERELARLYSATDVFVTAAEIGESHSYAIEEAMAFGIPVVTCSTPWVDNAQVEQVDEGRTGHVANHPRAFAEAVASIVADESRMAEMSAAARGKAEALYDARPLTEQLRGLYGALLAGEGVPEDWSPPLASVDQFELEYPRRLKAQFRALSEREEREVALERIRERTVWASRAAVSGLNREGLSAAYWAARARVGA
jgi:glycosyltransferase involved in cell wall biosynthesis